MNQNNVISNETPTSSNDKMLKVGKLKYASLLKYKLLVIVLTQGRIQVGVQHSDKKQKYVVQPII